MNTNFLVISDNRVIHKILYSDIVHVESKGMRSYIHISSGAKHSCAKNLGLLCKELAHVKMICRVHTSFAINLLKVERVQKDKQGLIVMINGCVIPISKRRKSDFFRKYLG